ncbi:MAG TPA: hypothetical protein VG815_05565, partial [Chloroflexota bacterium]|nr:hypothetical protein [Chloroflexota bacterium]
VVTPPVVAPVLTPPAPVVVPPVVAPAAKPPWGTDEEFNAERAWALIEGLRADKVTAATKAAEKATEDATKKVAETIGKALGLIPEDVLDPVKLQEKVSASESQSKQLALELAVFKAADGANANAGALLDSKSFLSRVAAIDPADTAALTAAIAAVVTENPLLAKTAPAAPTGGMKPNPAQGSSAAGGPLGLDAQIAAATAAGDFKTAIRLKAAKAITQ